MLRASSQKRPPGPSQEHGSAGPAAPGSLDRPRRRSAAWTSRCYSALVATRRPSSGGRPLVALGFMLAALATMGCDKQPEPRSKSRPSSASTAAPSAAVTTTPARPDITPSVPFRFPAPERLVALGDVHGDLAATLR